MTVWSTDAESYSEAKASARSSPRVKGGVSGIPRSTLASDEEQESLCGHA